MGEGTANEDIVSSWCANSQVVYMEEGRETRDLGQ